MPPKKISEQIGHRMQLARKQAGLTQKEIANKLHVSPISLSRWETGRRRPPFETLNKFALITKVPLHIFFITDGYLDITGNALRRIVRFLKDESGANAVAARFTALETLVLIDSDVL